MFDTTSAPVPDAYARQASRRVGERRRRAAHARRGVRALERHDRDGGRRRARPCDVEHARSRLTRRDFQVGQSDIGNNAVQFRDGRVLVYASISPGIRQVAFSYSVPASDFPLDDPGRRIRSACSRCSSRIPAATASGGGLAEQQPVSLEGRSFRRFLAQDVRQRREASSINVGAPTAPRGNRMLLVPVVVAAAIMALALAFALTRRRPCTVVARADAPDDAAHLARDIAELDDAFERAASPSDAERDAYQTAARCAQGATRRRACEGGSRGLDSRAQFESGRETRKPVQCRCGPATVTGSSHARSARH